MASIALDFRTNNGIIVEGTGIATSSTYAKNGLQVGGGAAIAQNIIVGSTATIWGNSKLYGDLTVEGLGKLVNNTSADSIGNGALQVSGGVYVGNNLYVNGTDSSSQTTGSNSIFTAGGLGVAKDGSFGGSLVVTGNFTVLGTQTIINSTATSIQDPIIDLGTGPGGEPLLGNDGYNKGIVIHYYDTQDNHMFFGRNNINGHFIFKENIDPGQHGSIPNADYVANGTYADVELGALESYSRKDAFSTNTGAIVTLGGIGAWGAIYSGSTVTGATLAALNISPGQLVYGGPDNTLIGSGILNINTFTGSLVGTVSTATTAQNIFGGLQYNLVIQTATNQTGFVTNGVAGNVLFWGVNGPTWGTADNITAGNATTATHLLGGDFGQIPFQNEPGRTTFSSALTFTNATNTLNVNKVHVTDVTNTNNTNSGALVVNGGAAVAKDLTVGGSIYVGGNIYLDGVGLDTVQGTTATFLNVNVTGTGIALVVEGSATVAQTLTATNLVVTGQTTLQSVTATVLTATSVTVFGPATVTGSTQLDNLTATITTVTQLTVLGSAQIGTINLGGTVVTADGGNFITVLVTGTNVSTSTTTGALQVAGGVGIGGNLWVGGTINVPNAVIGITTITTAYITDLTVSGASNLNGGVNTTVLTATDINVTGSTTIGDNLSVAGWSTLTDVTAVTLTVTNLNVTGSTILPGSINLTSLTVTNLTVTNDETIGNNLLVGNLFTATTATFYGGVTVDHLSAATTATFGGKVNIVDSTNSLAVTDGSFVTAGGIGVGQDIFAGGALNVGSITAGTPVPALYTNNILLASYTSPVISGTSVTNLDTYSATAYRTAKYFVQIVDGSNVHVTEITLFHDGTDVYKNEYAIATSDGELGTFDATLASSTVTLNFTPYGATAMKIKVVRLNITI